ncbi:secondary thiamine-phosphate synthase enzyme YjbQ [Marinilabiliaceae bacterium ANBcel2]|nr:secondary thiamine-phosphate synthase enzyme YjbQ [Marinilabiliaceae bacterium ANBcel2]
MIRSFKVELPAFKRGYHLITNYVESALESLPQTGIVNLFLQHTSAAITLNENVDPDVRYDFETIMNRIVPENQKGLRHTLEGSDDMPAHLKASLIGQSLTIPVVNGRLATGTWQGIYLCEFRNNGTSRKLLITLYGE